MVTACTDGKLSDAAPYFSIQRPRIPRVSGRQFLLSGKFGVVTGLEYQFHPLGDVLAGAPMYPPRDAFQSSCRRSLSFSPGLRMKWTRLPQAGSGTHESARATRSCACARTNCLWITASSDSGRPGVMVVNSMRHECGILRHVTAKPSLMPFSREELR
jgi:hypothetical protein